MLFHGNKLYLSLSDSHSTWLVKNPRGNIILAGDFKNGGKISAPPTTRRRRRRPHHDMTMTMTPPPTVPPPSAPSATASSSSSPGRSSGGCCDNSGIDIRDALSILSNRARGGGDVDTAAYSDGTVVPPTELKEMGQTIDMIVEPNSNNDIIRNNKISGCGCTRSHTNTNDDSQAAHPPMDKDELERHELLKQERARRGEEIRMQLRSMVVADLIGMIFRAQEERVATYHLFEE